jgi:hypothetical protein
MSSDELAHAAQEIENQSVLFRSDIDDIDRRVEGGLCSVVVRRYDHRFCGEEVDAIRLSLWRYPPFLFR